MLYSIHIKLIHILSTIVFIGLINFKSLGNDIVLNFREPAYPHYGMIYLPEPIKFDSITNTAIFTVYKQSLMVNAQIDADSIIYQIFNDGILLDKLIYPLDSISTWRNKDIISHHSNKLHIIDSINNDSLYFIPDSHMQYYDTTFNKYKFVLRECYKEIKDNNIHMFITSDNGIAKLQVKEDSVFHQTEQRNGERYKSKYLINDTIILSSNYYKITDLNYKNSQLILSPLNSIFTIHYDKLPEHIFKEYTDNFKGKRFLFIDIWGTWCQPCIDSFPKIKGLYNQYNKYVEFLSLCYDYNKNFKLSLDIQEKFNISYAKTFISVDKDAGENIINALKIESFPSYVLLDCEGNILLRTSGLENYKYICTALESLSQLESFTQ